MSAGRGRELSFDGNALSLEPLPDGRCLYADPRCFEGDPVGGCWASVCASADADAVIPFDDPQVQRARTEALAWWIPLLGSDLVCITTLALDESRYGGAITVARNPDHFADDPFARLFPGQAMRTEIFSAVAPPPGPVIERYAGTPWPFASFVSGDDTDKRSNEDEDH